MRTGDTPLRIEPCAFQQDETTLVEVKAPGEELSHGIEKGVRRWSANERRGTN